MTFWLPFMVALLLGATGITRQAWRDEHATWWAATIPLPHLGDLLSRVDVVLAPYYLFMRPWIAVAGDSVIALRLPSLLAMATAAGLTALLGARLYTPWIGLTAGTLFATIPSVSRYAEEARPYAFAICFAVATILALHARRWVLLALFVTLTGLSHLIALTVLLAHLPLVVSLPRRVRPGFVNPTLDYRTSIQGVRAKEPVDKCFRRCLLCTHRRTLTLAAWRRLQRRLWRRQRARARVRKANVRLWVQSKGTWKHNAHLPGELFGPPVPAAGGLVLPLSCRRPRTASAVGEAFTEGTILASMIRAVSGFLLLPARLMQRYPGNCANHESEITGVGGGAIPVWKWVLAVGLGLLPVVPLALLGVGQAGQVGWIEAGWRNLATLPGSVARSAAVAGVLGGLAVLGVLAGKADRVLGMLVVWLVAPVVAVFVVTPQFFYYRYLLFTLPAWALLAALGAAAATRAASRRRQTVTAVALCGVVLALGARDQLALRKSPLPGDQDYQGAAAYLGAHMESGDSVFFDGYEDRREQFGFAYEMRAGPPPMLCEQLEACTGRVWLVTNTVAQIPAGYTVLEERAFPGLSLTLLTRD